MIEIEKTFIVLLIIEITIHTLYVEIQRSASKNCHTWLDTSRNYDARSGALKTSTVGTAAVADADLQINGDVV